MKEADFTRSIMRKLPPEVYKWKIMNMMQNGVPDCYFSGSAGDLWVEFKYKKAPKRESTLFNPALSDLQLKWLNERRAEGRNVAVVLGSDIGCHIYHYSANFLEFITRKQLVHTRQDIVEWIVKETLG